MSPALVVTLAVILLTLIGDYFLKLAAIAPDRAGGLTEGQAFGLGVVMYFFSAIAVVIALRHMPVATFGVWYSVLTILAMAAMGVLLFEERLAFRDVLGIGLALAGLACMTRAA